MAVLQRKQVPVRVWRLCNGRGRRSKATALFILVLARQNFYWVLSQLLLKSKV
jgi:hypothetical protein